LDRTIFILDFCGTDLIFYYIVSKFNFLLNLIHNEGKKWKSESKQHQNNISTIKFYFLLN
jgi:phosphorylcholine metabolism protein LicD